MIVQDDIISLVNAAFNAGIEVDVNNLELLTWNAGHLTHIPRALPLNYSAIYIFEHNDRYLKVGQARVNSAARYLSQHYYTTSLSSLAKSLINDLIYVPQIGIQKPRNWIIQNTHRYNILIPNIYSKHFVNFAEAFFILKCNPVFER